jgi:transposase
MIQITPHQKLWLAIKPADFRRGIDGLAALCRQQLNENPHSGHLFIFTNRRRIAVKILSYDGQGFWLCLKRFSRGKLAWWPTNPAALYAITPTQLHILLYQGHPLEVKIPEDWIPIVTPPSISQESASLSL